MSDALSIADELLGLLNAANLSIPFTAIRNVLPFYELQELADLKVTVRPASLDVEASTREAGQYNYNIEIGVQKHMEGIEAEIPGLVAFVMAMAKFLRGKALTVNKALWVKTGIDPIFSVEHIQSGSVFTSLITVTYKTIE